MSSDPREHFLHRRHLLCGGGSFVFAAMMTSLLGGSKPVRAQTIAGSVPEVDRVSIRVVIDSYQFAVAAGKKMGSVDIQHFGWGLSGDKPPGRTLVSEFGLSMHAESKRGGETRNLLMDFGFTHEALNNNNRLLAVNPSKLDALVLSHGHYDHFGGTRRILAAKQGQAEKQATVLRWRRGVLLFTRMGRAASSGQFRCARSPSFAAGQFDGDLC